METKPEEFCFLSTPIGWLKITADATGVTGTELLDEPPKTVMTVTLPHLKEAYRQLTEYFRGERLRFTVPLNPRGADRSAALWRRLTAIPFGTTIPRTELEPLGAPAVRNPLPILVPCHRVLGAESELSGLAHRPEIAKRLLQLEGVADLT